MKIKFRIYLPYFPTKMCHKLGLTSFSCALPTM